MVYKYHIISGCLYTLSLLVVMVSFSQAIYRVMEEDDTGSGMIVEVCIELIGELERTVDVYVSTSDGTALGLLRVRNI